MELRTDFKYWAQEWLDHGRPSISATRLRSDRTRVNLYLLPTFGRRSVTRVREQQVREWLEALEDEGIGRATQHATLICLRGILQHAIDKGINMPENPAAKVSVEGMKAINDVTVKEIMTETELRGLVKNVDPNYQAMILLASCTGAKWEECLGLQVSDVHLDQGLVSIGRTRTVEGGEGVRYEPGHGREIRLVEMTGEATDALRSYLDATADWRTKSWEWVFLTKRDHVHPLRPNFNQFTWRPALRAAGIDERKYTFHDLRHAAAAHMILDEGWSLADVSKALGHTSETTTKRTYKNLFIERDKRQRASK